MTVRRGPAVILDAVTGEIRAGVCTAVAGRSGAGKSTLLRLLNRLAEPASGRILWHGRPLPELDVLDLRRRVGLVAQAPVLLTGRVIDDLRVGRPDLSEEQAAALLEGAGLPAVMLLRGTAGLSGGEAQRVCLARALAVGPEVLLADEPTAALGSRPCRRPRGLRVPAAGTDSRCHGAGTRVGWPPSFPGRLTRPPDPAGEPGGC